ARVPLPSARSGSPGTRKALREALGTPGGFDDIDSSVDEGDETTVDSNRWKFSSFFNRVRNGVSQHWHPEVLHASNDPDGRKYGTKTRRTRLVISLNPDGSLNRVRLEGSSDVDYLDEEAIRAVRTAAPFANPPPDLVDPRTGLIEFGFGFIFEFKGERRIFRYQR
ncbi:MAG: energy transducer TonB, partial [Deltaproteobacteria bacterium]|nr:energy transducer TonB [Nannocystaceae bacterium]